MSKENETISTHDYDKTHPVYIKVKKEFAKKLKAKYNCEDFGKIVDYVMDFVFEKKNSSFIVHHIMINIFLLLKTGLPPVRSSPDQ